MNRLAGIDYRDGKIKLFFTITKKLSHIMVLTFPSRVRSTMISLKSPGDDDVFISSRNTYRNRSSFCM